MAGPTTKSLDTELQELRSDLHKVEVAIVDKLHQSELGLKAALVDKLHQSELGLKAALVDKLHQSELGLKAEMVALGDKLHQSELGLKADLRGLEVGLSKLGAEFGVFKWLLGLTLLASLTGIASSIWWAATLTNRVGTLGGRVDWIDARLERIESSLGRLLELAEKPRPASPAIK